MRDDLDLPNRIRALRDARGLGVRDLAQLSGVDQSTINRMERGTQALDYPRGKKLAAALGVRFSGLLNDDDVELRADESGNAILSALESIPIHEHANVIEIARRITQLIMGISARHNAGALNGDPNQVLELATLWNDFDDAQRARALDILQAANKKRVA